MDESMHINPVEGEHLNSNTIVEGKHSFEGENERMNANVKGEQIEQNEDFHDLNDACSTAGSEHDDLYEDAPLEFDSAYPPMEKWTKDHPKEQIIEFHTQFLEAVLAVLGSEETKSKHLKNTAAESSEKSVKESKSTKSPKKLPITKSDPIKTDVFVADTPSTQKEIIPLKTGVFCKIKMKSIHKSRSPLTNVVQKPQVSHQGLLFREIPAPASPSSKKQRATDMAKHISKKKRKSKLIISSESTADDNETIPKTPEVDL
ncbi:unnamed protein product [Lactuca saligna]|uniref:Uncharacterized protein n=1 Tax=Lactuca saligna TaxID=75948 RepID=A0AA35VCI9_LACSI|nr:unnamed protein product [Lactuca saligna]